MLNQDNIQNDIRKIIYDILDEQNEYLVMKANDSLYDIGMDSIDCMNLLIKIEEKYQIEFEEENVENLQLKSIDDLSKDVLKLIKKSQ